MTRIPALLWGLAAGAGAAGAAGAQGPSLEADAPRAFGYQLGDLAERHLVVHVPDGWTLDAASLPRAGQRGAGIELRRLRDAVHAEAEGERHEITLQYQVFVSPVAVRTLEVAPFRLRVDGPGRSEDLRVEAWPLTVAPLVPVEVSPRRGLGELQPDRAPWGIDTVALRRRLAACAAAALGLLAALALLRFGPPWQAARRRPFRLAWRQLRRLPAGAGAADFRAACRALHAALNRSAGEVVFEAGLDRFVQAQPAYRALRADLARFLALSRREFFGIPGHDAGDAAWLVGLARRLRDAERGGA